MSATPQLPVPQFHFPVDLLVGATSATLSKTVFAPTERIRILLQNQKERLITGHLTEPYKGIIDCALREVKESGFTSLWRGNVPKAIRYVPAQAFNLAFNDFYNRLLGFRNNKDIDMTSNWLWVTGNYVAGGVAGVTSLFITYPVNYTLARLASDQKSSVRQFKGLFNVCAVTFKADGIAGFYRFFGNACRGTVVYRGFLFGTYGSVKPLLLSGDLKDSFLASFCLGCVVAVGAGVVSYPFVSMYEVTLKSLLWHARANIPWALAGGATLAGYDKIQSIIFHEKTLGEDSSS